MDQDRDYKWLELCRAAAIEQDSRKLMELVAEIIKELDKRDRRVKSSVVNKDYGGSSFGISLGTGGDQTCESGL